MDSNINPPWAPFGFTKKGGPRKRMPKEWKERKKRGRIIRQADYKRRHVPYDYLKYHGLVFAWFRKKYQIRNEDIDILLFLYSEKVFNKSVMKEYSMMYTFGRRKLEFLMEKGYLHTFRHEQDGRVAMYELTQLGKRLVNSIYKKLNGEEDLTLLPKMNDSAAKLKTKERAFDIAVKRKNKITEKKRQEARHPGRKKEKKRKGRPSTPRPAVFDLVD